MIDLSTLASPIEKGNEPLTAAQFLRRMDRAKNAFLPSVKQIELLATNSELASQIGSAMKAIMDVAEANNAFNHQLAAYRSAQARLARYRLADGRPEVTQEQGTGTYDEKGTELIESVVVQTAIEPLVATVEQTTQDEKGNVTTETVTNPLIVADDAERAAAQAIVDAASKEVREFDG